MVNFASARSVEASQRPILGISDCLFLPKFQSVIRLRPVGRQAHSYAAAVIMIFIRNKKKIGQNLTKQTIVAVAL